MENLAHILVSFLPPSCFFSNPWKLGTKKVHAYALFIKICT